MAPAKRWRVVGGADKGGILAREGQAIGSPALPERLATGAVVSELELAGERLHYRLEAGAGPLEGWVSLRLGEKELLVPHEEKVEEAAVAVGGNSSVPPCTNFTRVQQGDPPDRVRVWAVSDIHTDKKENKAWISGIDERKYLDDVLILAGDVSNSWEELEATLRELKARFARVFFCAGNHDLWVRKKDGEDSVAKLRRILQLCRDLGVETLPSEVRAGSGRLLVVPLLSWHQPQWDTEPDLEEWKAPRPLHQSVSDYWLTSWPESVGIQDGSAARVVDSINDELVDMAELLKCRAEHEAVVSFSHFVPRLEVNPEKRYFIPPCLAKAVGSNYLKARVETLRPNVHIFGHTHFGYDMEVDGVRYLQAALATPSERQFGGSLVALGGFPVLSPEPVLVWDSEDGWAPKRRSAWSDYYTRYGRRPEVTNAVPSVVADASGLTPASKSCCGGFLAGRMPIWLFGPLEHRLMEAQKDIETLQHRLATEAAADPKAKEAKAKSGSARDEPQALRALAAKRLASQGKCTFLDVRADAEAPSGGCRIAGSIPLPRIDALAGLPEEELLPLCERINALGGCFVVYGEGEVGATVYKAQHKTDRHLYALKVQTASAPGDRRAPAREVFALAAVATAGAHCEHLVRYFGSWQEDDRMHIQIELCESTLRHHLQRRVIERPLDPHFGEEDLMTVLRQTANGLATLHGIGFVHLDVKPDNILFGRDGCYKLGDLGLAISTATGGGPVTEGDCRYLAREVLQGTFKDLTKADVFSLGLVCYELATNPKELPQNGDDWQSLRDGCIDAALLSHLPEDLVRLLRRMVHKTDGERPRCTELAQHPGDGLADQLEALRRELREAREAAYRNQEMAEMYRKELLAAQQKMEFGIASLGG